MFNSRKRKRIKYYKNLIKQVESGNIDDYQVKVLIKQWGKKAVIDYYVGFMK